MKSQEHEIQLKIHNELKSETANTIDAFKKRVGREH